MSRIIQEVVEEFQTQHFWKDVVDHCNEEEEEERELEEALSLCDLPISKVTSGSQEDEAEHEEEDQDQIIAGEISDNNDFDFGSLVGSRTALDGEMCTADEVFSGGQILPYRNSVSSMSGLRSVSRSDSIDRRGFGSRSSSSRSSSIRSHYSVTSSSGSSSCSNNTNISTKTIPLVSKAKVQNQFHSYPSPRPQILGSGTRLPAYTPPVGKKSKMWEVLKLGLVRTPEIELRDLKLRQRTNNVGKTVTITRTNSTGSNSSIKLSNVNNTNNIDRGRKSCSNNGSNNVNNFVLEMQKRKTQSSETKIDDNNNNNNGFFKSCKCSVAEIIEPMPSARSDYGIKSGYYKISTNQISSSANQQVLNEDKNSGQKNNKVQMMVKEQKQQKRRNSNFRQEKQVTSHHQQHHHHHHRTFEWLKNLSHASVLNDS